MTFDGQTAVLYGGITGNVTVNNGTADITMKDSSPDLWLWHADTRTWSSTGGQNPSVAGVIPWPMMVGGWYSSAESVIIFI
jgi:hypothetical protein